MSPFWIRVSSVGHGVIASIVITKIIRLASGWLGSPISVESSGGIFLLWAICLGCVFGYFNVAQLMINDQRLAKAPKSAS